MTKVLQININGFCSPYLTLQNPFSLGFNKKSPALGPGWEGYGIQKRILLELEGYREGVGDLYGLTVVSAGDPLRHSLYNS